ncbi:DUF1801 domain-containing protein [Microlunatus speluncae]|uniref:DUF1801 domain-containing protein n=1 Tax=Microlunatus speluncae TaxID=2594267 RepID=UPI0012667023|nr:DUF1801 domain-containing protein [Microlunatus speluncae]
MNGTRKTQAGDGDVAAYLGSITDDRRRSDATDMVELMRTVTGAEPVLWGDSIVGFGQQTYTTADGKERSWFAVGLSARKAALTLYGLTYYESNADLLERLGPHKTGKGCLYLTRLDRVDQSALTELIERSWHTNSD